MPIATPNQNENEAEFIRRCMADDKMIEEFPDNGQRFAVCQSSWNEKTVQLEQMESNSQTPAK
jgi:hypothetical protein